MLQYLINASAIWLLSLLLFDALLRRERFHGYNRAYLLATLLAGCALPLLRMPAPLQEASGATLQNGVQAVARLKYEAAQAATPPGGSNWQLLLAIAYAAGAALMACLLVADAVKMLRYYSQGQRTNADGWTVIETGKEHTPFSFRNLLFVNARSCYTPDEWQMILQHEQQHTRLRHLADLCLAQLVRIVFWFHPLVHTYYRRLLMVHEYQADAPSAGHLKAYGSFLVEQALLHGAPSISHSFNRSPIKSRIIMLTHPSSKRARIKKVIIVPVVLLSSLFFSYHALSQDKKKHDAGVKFANVKSDFLITDMDMLISNPQLITTKPGCKVISYTYSVMPKNEFIFGPFRISGSKLRQEQVDYLKGFKGKEMKIFIEDIKLSCDSTGDIMPQVYTVKLK